MIKEVLGSDHLYDSVKSQKEEVLQLAVRISEEKYRIYQPTASFLTAGHCPRCIVFPPLMRNVCNFRKFLMSGRKTMDRRQPRYGEKDLVS